MAASLPQLGTGFELNRGQTDERVRYFSRGRGSVLFLTDNEAVMTLRMPEKRDAIAAGERGEKIAQARDPRAREKPPRRAVLRMGFAGSEKKVRITGSRRLKTTVKHYAGSEPKAWRTDIPAYGAVRYAGLYPGVDLSFTYSKGQPRYSFTIAPEADPSAIKLAFTGARNLRIGRDGDLVIDTPAGEVRHKAPRIFQFVNGRRVAIVGSFALRGDAVGFRVGKYDPAKPLVIDPVIEFSATVGGSSLEDPHTSVAAGPGGRVYFAGSTMSIDFPEAGGGAVGTGHTDVIVATFNLSDPSAPDAAIPENATYLAGTQQDIALDIAVDGNGNAFVVGFVLRFVDPEPPPGPDFPLANAFRETFGGQSEGFLTRLDPGLNVLSSTYLGGSSSDAAVAVAVEHEGGAASAIYVAGDTSSSDFEATVQPLRPYSGRGAGFVLKFDGTVSQPQYFSYLGGETEGSGYTKATGIVVHAGKAFVTGYTNDPGFPTVQPLQACLNQRLEAGTGNCLQDPADVEDAFVLKINTAGTAFEFSTFLGGNGPDWGHRIDVDDAGDVYILARTDPYDGAGAAVPYPATAGAYQAEAAGFADVAVSKIASDGSAVLYSTYIGGPGTDFPGGIAVQAGRAVVSGTTWSAADFSGNEPMPTDYTTGPGFVTGQGIESLAGADGFVLRLNRNGTALDYWGLIGGTVRDEAKDVAVAGTDTAYIVGVTESSDFWGSPQQTALNGFSDSFLLKLVETSEPPVEPGEPALAFFAHDVLRFYRAADWSLKFERQFDEPRELVFARNGGRLAAMDEGGLKVLDAGDGTVLSVLPAYLGQHVDAAFRPTDARDLAVITWPTYLVPKRYRLRVYGDFGFSGAVTLQVGQTPGAQTSAPRVTWSGDGSKLLVAYLVEYADGEKELVAVEIPVMNEELQSVPETSYHRLPVSADLRAVTDVGYRADDGFIATNIGIFSLVPLLGLAGPALEETTRAADLSQTESGVFALAWKTPGRVAVHSDSGPVIETPPFGVEDVAVSDRGRRVAFPLPVPDVLPGQPLPTVVLVFSIDITGGTFTAVEQTIPALNPHGLAFGGLAP